MESGETIEQLRIRELEGLLSRKEEDNEALILANSKLGYSVKIMSEFHLTQDDKDSVANSIDLAESIKDIKIIYDEYRKMLFSKALGEGSEFQMSQDFKDNSRQYFNVSIGYDPITKISENIKIIRDYFSYENDIRNTPNAAQRQAKTDVLLRSRPTALDALDSIISTVNNFSEEVTQI